MFLLMLRVRREFINYGNNSVDHYPQIDKHHLYNHGFIDRDGLRLREDDFGNSALEASIIPADGRSLGARPPYRIKNTCQVYAASVFPANH